MFLAYLRLNKTNAYLARRHGECYRCGACCKLMFHCPALIKDNGTIGCKIYDHRSRVCKIFPLTEQDRKDRDLVNPIQKCGFFFNNIHS
jgi:Fe-S-cluster containining protein